MDVKRDMLARQMLVTATIASADMLRAIKSHYSETIKPSLDIPGFRRGKAPRNLAEKRLGANEMYKPVLDSYFNKLAASSQDEDAVACGDFGFSGQLDGSGDVVLTCTVTFLPRVTALELDRILSEVSYSPPYLSDEDVDSEVARKCRPHMMEAVPDGSAISGCAELTIDFKGSVNGMPFPGGSATAFKYTVGDTSFIEGFEEQMMRLKAGESGRIDVSFPDDYPQESLTGRRAIFSVTIKSAKRMVSSNPDDQTARAAGFASLQDLRSKVKAHLDGVTMHESDRTLRQLILSRISAEAACETMSNDALNAMADAAWARFIDNHGFSEEQYARQRPELAGIARAAVKARIGLENPAGSVFESLCLTEAIEAAKTEWKMARWDSLKANITQQAVLDHIANQQSITATEGEAAARLREMSHDSDAMDRLDSDADFRAKTIRLVAREKALDWAVEQVKSRAKGR